MPLGALRIKSPRRMAVCIGPFTFLWFLFLVYFWVIFINRASRSYYLFFNYLSYYL